VTAAGNGVAQLDEALALTPVVEVQNRYALDSRRPGEDDVLRACGSGASRSCRSSPSPAPAGSGGLGAGAPGGAGGVRGARRHPGPGAAGVDAAPGPARARDQGTGTPAHLEENVAAAALRLTDAEVARLDGLYRAAGWVPERGTRVNQ
jgi:hypothetical protein